MKHLFTTALLCGASVLATQAQSIVVTDKDGIPHKFHADYVQEITFEEIENTEGYDFKFNEITVTTYGNRNIGLNFSDGVNVVALDLYQPEPFIFSQAPTQLTVHVPISRSTRHILPSGSALKRRNSKAAASPSRLQKRPTPSA